MAVYGGRIGKAQYGGTDKSQDKKFDHIFFVQVSGLPV